MELGGLVESQVCQSIYTLANFNGEAASQVIAPEAKVNAMEVGTDREAASTIVIEVLAKLTDCPQRQGCLHRASVGAAPNHAVLSWPN